MNSKQSTKPSKAAMPHINAATSALTGAVNANAPNLANIGNTLSGAVPGLASRAFGPNANLDAAQSYATDVIGGKYLGEGNPYLDQMIDRTKSSVTDDVNAIFSRSGRTGGNQHVGTLAGKLGEAELGLRYGQYNEERQAMDRAASLMPSLEAARYAGVPAVLGLSGAAAEIPLLGSKVLASGIGNLWGGSTTTTQKQGIGGALAQIVGSGLAGWASGGFGG